MIKKTLFIFLLLLFLYNNLFSQKDTTICFEVNSTENQNIKKNVLSLDICYFNTSIPMYGINYERIIKRNNTISVSAGSMFYPIGYYDFVFSYGKVESRFYFPGTSFSKLSSFNDDFYLQKKKHSLIIPEGLYIGIAATFYDYHNSEDINSFYEETHSKLINSFGIGGSIGYQFLLFNKISANISLPLILENRTTIYFHQSEPYEKTFFDLRSLININLGIAF